MISKTLTDDDADWEIVNKRDIIQDENVENEKDCSSSKITILKNNNENKNENKNNISDQIDNDMTVAEADIISQIRLMFIEKNGKHATSVEEIEWLKSIREVTGNGEEEKRE